MNQLCTGCNWFTIKENCAVRIFSTSCPCIECLVKSMCRKKCKERKDYFNNLSKAQIQEALSQ